MKTNPVSLKFTSLSATALLEFARNVHASVTGSGHFTNFHPTPDELLTRINNYQSAIMAAVNGGRLLTMQKNQAREELLPVLRSWSVLVGQQCNGDMMILLSSGFLVSKSPTRAGKLPAPKGLRLRVTATPGEVSASTETVPNGKSFEYQTSPTGTAESDWVHAGTFSSCRVKLTALVSGAKTWVRARAIGAAGPGDWCDPVAVRAA